MITFDEELINDILKENFVNKNPNYKYAKTERSFILKTKDTPEELKSFTIYMNRFNTELFISHTEIKYEPKLLHRKWKVRCLDYNSFNYALTYLINKQ